MLLVTVEVHVMLSHSLSEMRRGSILIICIKSRGPVSQNILDLAKVLATFDTLT